MSRIPIYEVYFVSINELYFVSKQVKNSNQRGALRLRGVLGRWSGTVGQSRMSKNSNQRGVLRLQASLYKASEREREGGREREKERQEFQSTRCISCPNMSRIPINEATRCTSSPSMSRIPINEVYFVSKQPCAKRARERERERAREGGREGGRGKHVKNSKNYEVYFVSKQVCAKRVRERERGREKERQAWQEFQSTRCTSSPSMSRISINEVHFVSINEL